MSPNVGSVLEIPAKLATPRAETLPGPFLTAQWRHLALVNYELDPALLEPYLPHGTELDQFEGRCYASVVGFQFLDARLLGLAIPHHRNFEEVNLRFYVRRRVGDQWRPGVVFLKEICPRWAVSTVARRVYNERYVTLPMRHKVVDARSGPVAEYSWKRSGHWERVRVCGIGRLQYPARGSLEEFLVEHYYAYTSQRDGGTLEYRVDHPAWRIWTAGEHLLEADIARLYGPQFSPYLGAQPACAFLADGSSVCVRRGVQIG